MAVHHTHISVVFLAGPHAYKIKKAVNLSEASHNAEPVIRRSALVG